jgi:outer membrane protein assembly factor BamB
MSRSIRPALVLAAALVSSGGLPAQEWSRFRGPNGTGISEAKGVPVSWTEKDFRWRVEIPGQGHSQPVIWEDRIFLTSATELGKERMLLCLRKEDGKELWVKKYPLPTHKPGNGLSSYANGSPAVDKDRVYACFVSADQFLVKAFDHAGKELWSKNLGAFNSQHGHGASPVLYENKLIVTNDQDATSSVVALDIKTGQPVWECPRKPAKEGTAYGTPCIVERNGKTELLLTSRSHGISSLDPKTGSENWEADVFDKRSVASPVVVGDLVVGSCGSGAGTGNFLVAVRLGGKGDVTSSNVAYTIRKSTPYVPTPLAQGNRLYLVSDGGIASAIDAPTGKTIWSERIGDTFYGSPVMVDGKIYVCSAKGEMVVFATGDDFKILGRSPMGEGSHSTPCIDGNRLYLKTFTHLVCVGGK